ncbi:MAG: DUF2283 domain-containing protein [Candidatus Bathyarchaeota archaeon]|nr:DUF2283 domain-containing protein [Candidatus Bathyarchaeota archaeon]
MAKSEIVALSTEVVDVEYDEKADVLYISFSPDSQADDSELTENDVVIRYKKRARVSNPNLRMTSFGGIP